MKSELNHKAEFRAKLLVEAKSFKPGHMVTDTDLRDLCARWGLSLTLKEIMVCVAQSERAIATQSKIRLQRLRTQGYRVTDGEEQFENVSKEGASRVLRIGQKTATRLEGVDMSKLSPDSQTTLFSRKYAWSALLNIMKSSICRPKLEKEAINVLDSANMDLLALEQLKNK